MTTYSRRHILSIALLMPLGLAGCMTKRTAEAIKDANYETHYQETISQFLISQDGKNLVILGHNYHYIFDAPQELKAILQSDLHKKVIAEFNSITIDSENHVFAEFTLKTDEVLTAKEQKEIEEIGFKKDLTKSLYTNYFRVTGTRYSAEGFAIPAGLSKLNYEYRVNITEKHKDYVQKAGLIALTPVAVAADGVLIIAAVPLLLIGVTVFAIQGGTLHFM